MSDEAPELERAREQYRRSAPTYERRTAFLSARYRRRAVDLLRLARGDVVVDVACGTGVNFGLVERSIGPTGRIVGVDASPDMLALARVRVVGEGYTNVTLIESPIEDMQLDERCDAALFSLTHDVLQSPGAVESVIDALRPAARVASLGAKWAEGPLAPVVNAVVRRSAEPYVTTFAGFEAPWRLLAERVPDLHVESVVFGGAYLAWGAIRDESADA